MFFSETACVNKEQDVARMDRQKVTFSEFKMAYPEILKQPNVFDSHKLREDFLDELINRKLVAQKSREVGMLIDERMAYKIEAYRDKQLREAHFKDIIATKIKVDSNESKKVYGNLKKKCKIKHLFVTDKKKADSLYHLLTEGANWNHLARVVFSDSQLANNGGELGWVHWDQLEYDMAQAVFSLKPGSFSPPIKDKFGFQIVFVEDFEKELMISAYDEKIHRAHIQMMIRTMKGDKIANQYISKLMFGISIRIKPSLVKLIKKRLKKTLLRPPSQYDQMSGMQLTEGELRRIETNLWDYRNDVLAVVDGQELTIAVFMEMLNYVPYQVIQQSFKRTLDYTIRDFVLTNDAKKMAISKRYKFVDQKTELYTEYLLQRKYIGNLLRNIKLSKEDIQLYLAKLNIKNDQKAIGPGIRKQILNDKRSKYLSDIIKKLRENTHIEKHTAILHTYYDRIAELR